jgi:hypothetical protein
LPQVSRNSIPPFFKFSNHTKTLRAKLIKGFRFLQNTVIQLQP